MNGVCLKSSSFFSSIKQTISSICLVSSKTATSNIYRLVLEPDDNDDSLRSDFRILVEQAIPIELRQWVRISSKSRLFHFCSVT